MIFTRAVLVYLTFVISHITTAFEGFHMETLMTERKRECERSLEHIEDVIEGEEQSKHFWLKSALHDNQILTGKLNNILIGVGYRKVIPAYIQKTLNQNIFNSSSVFW